MSSFLKGMILFALFSPTISYASNVHMLDTDKLNTTESTNFDIDVMQKLLTAEIALDRRQVRVALKLYLQTAQDTQDPEIAQRATDIAILFAGLDTALEPATIWANAKPNDLQAQATVAAILLTQLKARQSIPFLARLESADPERVTQHFQVLYDELQTPEEKSQVIQALTMLIEQMPERSGAYLTLSNIYLNQNKPDKALSYSEMALEKGFNDTALPILHAQALHQLNRQPDALLFLADAAENAPNNSELQLYLTEVLLRVWNDSDTAHEQLTVFMEGQPSAEEILAGVILSIEFDWYPEAKTLLNTLKSIPEHEETAEYFLGRVSEFENNPNAALNWYENVDTGQYQAVARLRMAALLTQQNKLNEALDSIHQAKPMHPEDVKLLALIELEILSQMDRYEDAFMALSETLTILPFDTDLLYIRALLAEKLNNLQVAEGDLRRIIRIYPNHIEALNALGYILANRTERVQEAMALIQKALNLSPNNPGILDSLGWAYFKKGDLENAEKYLRQAQVLSDEPLIAAHLGEVLFAQGKTDEANTIWTAALKEAPSDETLIDVIRRLMPEKAQAANNLDTQ